MDLIDKIKNILVQQVDLAAANVDLHYDANGNVFGYVSDSSFFDRSDDDVQKLIWEKLNKFLDSQELLRVSSIVHETPNERVRRLTDAGTIQGFASNYWKHNTDDLAKYWLFVDSAKFKDQYRSLFLIINERYNWKKALIFKYDDAVIRFMELPENEIDAELCTNALQKAEEEIKADLIMRYNKWAEEHQQSGSPNIYRYVFSNFLLSPVPKNKLLFTNGEAEMLSKYISKLKGFTIYDELKSAIQRSRTVNNMATELV